MLLPSTERRGPGVSLLVGAQGHEVPKAGRGQRVPAKARSALVCAGRDCPVNAGVHLGSGSLVRDICLLSVCAESAWDTRWREAGLFLGTGTSQAMLYL